MFVFGDTNKRFVVVNKSDIDIRTVLIWVSLLFIIPISSIAYVISLEEGEFNLDPITNDINYEKENKVSHSDNSPEGKYKENLDMLEIKVEDNSYDPYLEEDLIKSNTKLDLDNYPIIDKNVIGKDKTLYEGFVQEISKTRNKDNITESKTDESVSDGSTKTSSLWSPTNTESSNETNNTSSSTELSPDYTKDKFTPVTLSYLDAEIRRNSENLKELSNICKDDITKSSLNENLIDERKYLLEQKSNHLNSVLHEAKNTPINDLDIDKLHKDISELKTSVDKLLDESESLKEKDLDCNKNNVNSQYDENNSNSKESN